jgi:hypothetical protein
VRERARASRHSWQNPAGSAPASAQRRNAAEAVETRSGKSRSARPPRSALGVAYGDTGAARERGLPSGEGPEVVGEGYLRAYARAASLPYKSGVFIFRTANLEDFELVIMIFEDETSTSVMPPLVHSPQESIKFTAIDRLPTI